VAVKRRCAAFGLARGVVGWEGAECRTTARAGARLAGRGPQFHEVVAARGTRTTVTTRVFDKPLDGADFVAQDGLTDLAFTCTPASRPTKRRGAAVAAPNNCIGRSELQRP